MKVYIKKKRIVQNSLNYTHVRSPSSGLDDAIGDRSMQSFSLFFHKVYLDVYPALDTVLFLALHRKIGLVVAYNPQCTFLNFVNLFRSLKILMKCPRYFDTSSVS